MQPPKCINPGTVRGRTRGEYTGPVEVQGNMYLGVFTAGGKKSHPTIKWNPVSKCVCVCENTTGFCASSVLLSVDMDVLWSALGLKVQKVFSRSPLP